MPYDSYTIGHPDGTTGNGATFATQLQNNLNALQHGVVIGIMEDWNFAITVGTGSASQPQYHTYSRGVYRLRATITWNGDGNPSAILWEFSGNSGSSYDTIGTVTYTYDASLNVLSYSWS